MYESPTDINKATKLLKELEKQMFEHADQLEFEQAASIRDKIEELKQGVLFA